jgi:hypothetical protein
MGDPDESVAAGSHTTIGPLEELGDGDGAPLNDGVGETDGVGEGPGEQAASNRVAMRNNRLIAAS